MKNLKSQQKYNSTWVKPSASFRNAELFFDREYWERMVYYKERQEHHKNNPSPTTFQGISNWFYFYDDVNYSFYYENMLKEAEEKFKRLSEDHQILVTLMGF